jgi:hypothetical protein
LKFVGKDESKIGANALHPPHSVIGSAFNLIYGDQQHFLDELRGAGLAH